MLLRIKNIATGQYLVLEENSKLSVEVNTTIFNNQDTFLGSKTYPGTCQLEPNKAAIQNAHHILTDAALRKFPIIIYLGNLPWKQGVFSFTITKNVINYEIYFDASLIVNQLKTKYLNEMSDPNINDQLHFDTLADFKAYLQATTTAAPGTYPMVFFPFKNDHLYKTIAPADYSTYPDIDFPNITPYINAWEIASDGTGKFLVDSGYPASQTQSPFFSLPYILKRIVRYFGFEPIGSWLYEEESSRIVIFSMVPLNWDNIIPEYYYFMPYIPVSDFIKWARTTFGLLIDFNEIDKTCIIESLVNLVKTDEILDLRAYQTTDYEETGTSSDAYTISQQADDKDEAYSDTDKANLPIMTIGDLSTAIQVTDVPLTSAPTKMLNETSPANSDTAGWRIPYVKQPIYPRTPLDQISELAYADRSSFKLRALYYHGMMPDDAGFLYPYGSADNLDKDGNALTRYSLALGSASTAFVSIRNYHEFLKNSKPFRQGFNLPAPQVLSIKANKRILLRDFNQATVSCLLGQVGADLGNKPDTDCTCTVYPIINLANAGEVNPVIIPGPPAPPFDNGTVWVKFEIRNVTAFDITLPPPERSGHRQDLYAKFYADSAATIPKDVTALDVRYRVTEVIDFDSTHPVEYNVTTACTSTGHESELAHQVLADNTSGGHNQSYSYALLGSAYYNIIP